MQDRAVIHVTVTCLHSAVLKYEAYNFFLFFRSSDKNWLMLGTVINLPMLGKHIIKISILTRID